MDPTTAVIAARLQAMQANDMSGHGHYVAMKNTLVMHGVFPADVWGRTRITKTELGDGNMCQTLATLKPSVDFYTDLKIC